MIETSLDVNLIDRMKLGVEFIKLSFSVTNDSNKVSWSVCFKTVFSF